MRKLAIATNIWAKQNNKIFFENLRVEKFIELRIITQIATKNNPRDANEILSHKTNTPNKIVIIFHKFSNGTNDENFSFLKTNWFIFIWTKNNINVAMIIK